VRLIEAFHQARHQGRLPHRLVIGGGQGWLYEAIYQRVSDLKLHEHVHFTGFVADTDLPALYSAAEFFAYPSLYEGFGLPIVEALACGTPVLAGNNSSLPEAGGPGAFYVDAEEVDAIAQGLVQLATDPALRARLRQAGLLHAAQFTWQRSAEQLLVAYTQLLG
jgi:glycosyltransferase involved in cell wall biosynthesis